MKYFVQLLAFALLLPCFAACGLIDDARYLREGTGVSLYYNSIADNTGLQEVYVAHICRQAGFTPAIDSTGCLFDAPKSWSVFVQAGLNDIDARCDTYLAWLDDKRRSTSPILQEISDIRTATTGIMAIAGVGVEPIAIASAAFGLASNTFTNVRSRLVLEVNHSTVQAIVLSGQRRLREEIVRLRIDNKPAALHALRQYLRICMPFTIETSINTTITAFERGGPDALVFREPLVTTQGTTPPIGRSQVVRNSTVSVAEPARWKRVQAPSRVGDYESSLQPPEVKILQKATCLSEDGVFSAAVRNDILAYLNTRNVKDRAFDDRITAVDGIHLRREAREGPSCADQR